MWQLMNQHANLHQANSSAVKECRLDLCFRNAHSRRAHADGLLLVKAKAAVPLIEERFNWNNSYSHVGSKFSGNKGK